MNENYIKISFIWEIELYKQKSTTEILLCSKEYQDIGKQEFSFCISFTSNYLKALFKYPKATGSKKPKYFKSKSSYMHLPYMDGLIYKKSVCGLIAAKDSIGHKIIHALSTSTIWDKIFIIYSNKQCHCTESAKWSMLESFDSYAIKLV